MTSAECKALLWQVEFEAAQRQGREGRVGVSDEVHGRAARLLAPRLRQIEERAASETDLPVGSGKREATRRAANYLSKYVSTTVGAPHSWGRHRYDVGQSFQPPVQRLIAATAEKAVWFAWA